MFCDPLEAFSPLDVIKNVLDNFYAIGKHGDLSHLIQDTYLLNDHHQQLFDLCLGLWKKLEEIWLQKKNEAGKVWALIKSGAKMLEKNGDNWAGGEQV